jgi:hypothetical protein
VVKSRRFDSAPETARDKRFFDLRDSGWTGPIDQDGRKVTGGRAADILRITAASELPALSLRGLLDVIRAAEPGCFCDPELFTGPAGVDDEPPEDEAARVAVARQVCAACPARLACLAYALRTHPAAGVWAGCTADEIRSLAAAARHPARPGQDAVLRAAAGKAVA